MCVDTNYYATFNRDNVTLIDLRQAPIETLTQHGVRTTADVYKVDAIVFAIGFDAMTGSLTRIDIRGRGGQALPDKWEQGPRTYLGLAVAGFPNLFMITGPGNPSVLSNIIVSIEQHVDWISDCIADLRRRGDRGNRRTASRRAVALLSHRRSNQHSFQLATYKALFQNYSGDLSLHRPSRVASRRSIGALCAG
jgi:cation diffusion facilitator CzcD-associated flavoprotein CzcO